MNDKPLLLPHHQAMLDASAIPPDVARSRGYRTVQTAAELKRLGFGAQQLRVPALLIPVYNVFGEIATYQSRPDSPRVNREGKMVKYETPHGTKMVLDVPPAIRSALGDPSKPMISTEGIRKADAAASRGVCCTALLGVWNWRGSNEVGGKMALPDWEMIALNGRQVYLCFDSDVMLKPAVHQAMARLKAFLEMRRAQVSLIYLLPAADGQKVGLDDYLAKGHTTEELLALASADLRSLPDSEAAPSGDYRETASGLEWLRSVGDERIPVPLTNFTARIIGDIKVDDGAETQRQFEFEACLGGESRIFAIPASQFGGMQWIPEHLGARAIVYPGNSLREHTRVAIQMMSGDIQQIRIYAHTGWRQMDGEWAYLHADGAIGPNGAMESATVRLGEGLQGYRLPEPPIGKEGQRAVRDSLRSLEVAPDWITLPLYAAIWRAPLGPADFAIHVVGPSGAGKSEEVALAQQH